MLVLTATRTKLTFGETLVLSRTDFVVPHSKLASKVPDVTQLLFEADCTFSFVLNNACK